jgi:hypothetical protein
MQAGLSITCIWREALQGVSNYKRMKAMSMTFRGSVARESAAYGGLVDAFGGIATVVLAIVGLASVNRPLMTAIATIVFGVALLIQAGTMLSEYAQVIFPSGASSASTDQFGSGNNLSAVFVVGVAGIVLGVLALLDIAPSVLPPIAVIAFGSALVLSSSSVWQLYSLRQTAARGETQPQFGGGEVLASEMASGSAGIQVLAGLAAIVLGVIAVAGSVHAEIVTLVALLVVGATTIMTGTSLSATVMSFMRRA